MRLYQIAAILIAAAIASTSPASARKPTFHPDEQEQQADERNPDAKLGPNYMTQQMQAQITPRGMEVWVPGRMPKSNDEPAADYPYYPATIVYNNDPVASLASPATTVRFAYRQWGYRCDLCAANTFNNKPNEILGGITTSNGTHARISYTTYERAMAAQIAVMLYVAGYPAHAAGGCGAQWCGYLDATRAVGIPDSQVIPWSTAVSQTDRIFTTRNQEFMTVVDAVVLPPVKLSAGVVKPWGVICICEYADMRLASKTLWVTQQITQILHAAGYKYAVSPDSPLGSGRGAGFCGIGQKNKNCDMVNLTAIANTVDALLVGFSQPPAKGVGSFPQSLVAMQALFDPSVNRQHLVFRLVLGKWPRGTTIADAEASRQFLLEQKWGGVGFSWIYAERGGDRCRLTVQKVLILLGLPRGSC
jgi:hypothetical protein